MILRVPSISRCNFHSFMANFATFTKDSEYVYHFSHQCESLRRLDLLSDCAEPQRTFFDFANSSHISLQLSVHIFFQSRHFLVFLNIAILHLKTFNICIYFQRNATHFQGSICFHNALSHMERSMSLRIPSISRCNFHSMSLAMQAFCDFLPANIASFTKDSQYLIFTSMRILQFGGSICLSECAGPQSTFYDFASPLYLSLQLSFFHGKFCNLH